MRAISRFGSRNRALSSSAPVADWKRRLKSCLRVSAICPSNSSSVMSRSCLALKEITVPSHELRLDRQLLARQAKRVLRELLRHAGELEHDSAWLHDSDPAFG